MSEKRAYELYADNCTKPIYILEETKPMVRDTRPISDAPYDAKIDDKATIGKFLCEILESQEEAMSSLNRSLTVLWGAEVKETDVSPKSCHMSALNAILEHQKAITSAVKAIEETL